MSLVSRAVALCVACAALLLPASAQAAVTPPWDPFFAPQQTVADFGATTRPFGVAEGDFDGDGDADLVVGRTTGNVAFVRNNGDGTFAAPVAYAWKQAFFNGWSFAAGDVNSDGKLDVVWGASADSPNATSPVVADGDVRAWLGNGDGTFQQNAYTLNGVVHNAGIKLADIGTDAGSVDVADIDGDNDQDVVAGAISGTNSVVTLLRNAGGGAMEPVSLVSQPTATSGDGASPTYFPAISTQNSPWGLAFGDTDADGDQDLFVGDRGLYVYLFQNDGAGAYTVKPGNIPGLESRPNVYLRHDAVRPSTGYTPSLGTGDVDGDGRADLLVGLHSGAQTPASNVANDGKLLLDLSKGGRHQPFVEVTDVGTMARGATVLDADGDGAQDLLAATYEGKVQLVRQLEPKDTDGDGLSDYVDLAPEHPSFPRIDMDGDQTINAKDQYDADHDGTGDPADGDDDNDGVADDADNCAFAANGGQDDVDGDDRGDACDPLDGRDGDDDGVPTGPTDDRSKAAAAKWASAPTKFVLRIDALGRFFQNEFTGLMHDAAVLNRDEWLAKCQGMYDAADPPLAPCADLGGGVDVETSTVVIPRLLWTDPEVVTWINDRIKDPHTEIGQHGTYHDDNAAKGDWKDLTDRNFFSCETCGLTLAENLERLRTGQEILLGDYDSPWVSGVGATAASPRIDWSQAAQPLITYAAPYNTSDPKSREALAQLGFKAFTASRHEESPTAGYGEFFSDPESSMEKFGPTGMFHVSADTQLDPPEGDLGTTYDQAERDAFQQVLESNTQVGGLNTWLIEEVEWSGRPCNHLPRLPEPDEPQCPTSTQNRENNTVYRPRWDAWVQLLEYVRNRPSSVVMTLGEVALAKGYDNAPTVDNADQADADHDGVGDVVEGVTVTPGGDGVVRNAPSTISATVRNGAGDALADQEVELRFDADGDGEAESYAATTGADGVAKATVTATRPVGPAGVVANWSGGHGLTASGEGSVDVRDETSLTLDAANPSSGQVTDAVAVGAVLTDSDGQPLAGRSVAFAIGDATATAATDDAGRASASLTLEGPAGAQTLTATFAGADAYGQSSASSPFTVDREATTITLGDVISAKRSTTVSATLVEADGAPLAGRTLTLAAEVRKGRAAPTWQSIGTAQTGADGVATFDVPSRYKGAVLGATFAGDPSFLGSTSQP